MSGSEIRGGTGNGSDIGTGNGTGSEIGIISGTGNGIINGTGLVGMGRCPGGREGLALSADSSAAGSGSSSTQMPSF